MDYLIRENVQLSWREREMFRSFSDARVNLRSVWFKILYLFYKQGKRDSQKNVSVFVRVWVLLCKLIFCFLNFVLSSIYSVIILEYVECWESVNIFLIKDNMSIVSKVLHTFDTFDRDNFFLYKWTITSLSDIILTS